MTKGPPLILSKVTVKHTKRLTIYINHSLWQEKAPRNETHHEAFLHSNLADYFSYSMPISTLCNYYML